MYSETRIVKSTDVNINRQLKSSSIFTMAQEMAMIHASQIGMGTDHTLDKGILWVVVRQCAQIYKIPKYEDIITLETWVGKPLHIFMPRYTRFKDEAGNTLIDLNAFWALLDAKGRNAVNIDDTDIKVIPETAEYGELPRPKAIRKIETDKSADFIVPYSSTDLNGHFTNSKYLDLAEDLIPEIASTRTPKCIKIEYSNEILFGEHFTLDYTGTDDFYYFSGSGAGKHRFTLQLEY